MKKVVIFVLMLLVITSTIFAGGLEVNEKTMMMTYTYVVEENDSPYTSYGANRFLRAKAMSEFAGTLQRSFELNSVNLSQVEYEYQPGKILMTMSFETFYNLNLK